MAPPRRPPSRPGLRIAAVGAVLVALYATMFGTGHTSPLLGLDLRGGTTVILTPEKTNGVSASKAQLDEAVTIIRQRVDGFGVAGAQVVTQGNNVVITVPGRGISQVKSLEQTASLTFREIYTDPDNSEPVEATTGVPPGGTPTASASVTPSASGSGSASPSASATASAGASATAPTTSTPTTSTPTTSTPTTTATSTAKGRALSKALLAAPVATTTPSPTPSATADPTPTISATSTATGTASSGVGPSVISAPTATTKVKETLETVPTAAELTTFENTNCSKNGGVPIDPNQDDPDKFITACDSTQGLKYLLTPAEILGTDVSSATATIETTSTGASTGEWVVNVTFKDSAVSKVEAETKKLYDNSEQPLAITLDGVVVSLPATDAVLGKNIQISGGSPSFTESQANNLADALKYGSLPVAFTPSQVESVSATLGRSSLNAGLLAGSLGLGLVLIYVFLYYRMLGFVTVASLLVSGLMVFASVTLLGQIAGLTLSLPGIAGFIVAVGITADSFVVFFERLKDELRDGRSPRLAVEYSWVRARRTIFSADTISFLAAVILYLVSVGDVKGFAFTLGLSTVLDIFTVVLFTKPLMTILIRYPLFSTLPASGLSSGRVGRAAAGEA